MILMYDNNVDDKIINDMNKNIIIMYIYVMLYNK